VDWATVGSFPMTWKDGQYKITVPRAPSVTSDGFRVQNVEARRGRKKVNVDSDLGYHNPPTVVPHPRGDIIAGAHRLMNDPLTAFRTMVSETVRHCDGS
jgi:hypothetical protein